MDKVVDSSIEVSEFELQSCYYVHFQTNTLGKGMNSLVSSSAMVYIVPLLYFYKDSIGIK